MHRWVTPVLTQSTACSPILSPLPSHSQAFDFLSYSGCGGRSRRQGMLLFPRIRNFLLCRIFKGLLILFESIFEIVSWFRHIWLHDILLIVFIQGHVFREIGTWFLGWAFIVLHFCLFHSQSRLGMWMLSLSLLVLKNKKTKFKMECTFRGYIWKKTLFTP